MWSFSTPRGQLSVQPLSRHATSPAIGCILRTKLYHYAFEALIAATPIAALLQRSHIQAVAAVDREIQAA